MEGENIQLVEVGKMSTMMYPVGLSGMRARNGKAEFEKTINKQEMINGKYE
jgi:hypothetical protein